MQNIRARRVDLEDDNITEGYSTVHSEVESTLSANTRVKLFIEKHFNQEFVNQDHVQYPITPDLETVQNPMLLTPNVYAAQSTLSDQVHDPKLPHPTAQTGVIPK